MKTKTGKSIGDITIQAVNEGKVTPEDIQISGEMLLLQSRTAAQAGRPQMADNFVRAAEMSAIPDQVLLDMYNKLRPNRSTKEELLRMADDLTHKYNAKHCGDLVREAAAVYEKRGILL